MFKQTFPKTNIKVDKVKFADKVKGFYIFSASLLDNPSEKLSFKGSFAGIEIRPLVLLTVEGTWSEHPKWGKGVDVTSWSFVNDGADSLTGRLSAQMPDVPYYVLKKLTDILWQDNQDPEQALIAFEHNPTASISKLDTMSALQRSNILDSWKNYKSVNGALEALRLLNLPDKVLTSAHSLFGSNAAEILQLDPYRLLDVEGVNLSIADRFAQSRGVDPDSPRRLDELLYRSLKLLLQEGGHFFISKNTFYKHFLELVEKGQLVYSNNPPTIQALNESLDRISLSGRVYIQGQNLWIMEGWETEDRVAQILSQKLKQPPKKRPVDPDEFLDRYERTQGISLSDAQKDAIRLLSTSPVVLLTGLPGTGKSTVSRAMVRYLKECRLQVTLLAPTGIAAKRLTLIGDEDASTIHRALNYRGYDSKGEEIWLYNQDTIYDTDAVLVDEMSMVDLNVFSRLLVSLDLSTALILVGDSAQLPSVGAGNVLHDLIQSNVIPRVHLTQIFRQEEASDIIINAHKINAGEAPVPGSPVDPKVDFRFVQMPEQDTARNSIIKLVQSIYEKNKVSSTPKTFQVISPRYTGPLGVDILNEELRAALNPLTTQREHNFMGTVYREGDRVMVIKNDYLLDVYNGDTGKIDIIDFKTREVLVKIYGLTEKDTKVVSFKFDQVPIKLKLAFAITTHRSQGQEWDYVFVPLHNSFSHQLQRNLLYTAVTRAKKKVWLLGEWNALCMAVKNDALILRNTDLANRLRSKVTLNSPTPATPL